MAQQRDVQLPLDALFRRVRMLGSGTSGVVYEMHLARPFNGLAKGTTVAVKLIPEDAVTIDVEREVKVLQYLASTCNGYVLCFLGTTPVTVGDTLYLAIVTEYLRGPSLQITVESNFHPYNVLAEPRFGSVIGLLQQLLHLARGLAHLHAAGWVHRDIKPDNIVWSDHRPVNSSLPLVLKYIDLGYACNADSINQDVQCLHRAQGTPYYLAPELWTFNLDLGLNGKWVDIGKQPVISADDAAMLRAGDVYSLGLTYFLIVRGRLPFAATTKTSLYEEKQTINLANYTGAITALVPGLSAVILGMTQQQWRSRLTAAQVVIQLEAVLTSIASIASSASAVTTNKA